MTVISLLAGAALILLVLHDRQSTRRMSLAGPLGMTLTLLVWATLLAVGWALVYLPYLTGSFEFASGMEPSDKRGFGTALYLSIVTLATLGYGDITPATGWFRVLAPLESLMGFALLTAGVTWILSLHPVLGRKRALAHEVHLFELQRLQVLPQPR